MKRCHSEQAATGWWQNLGSTLTGENSADHSGQIGEALISAQVQISLSMVLQLSKSILILNGFNE